MLAKTACGSCGVLRGSHSLLFACGDVGKRSGDLRCSGRVPDAADRGPRHYRFPPPGRGIAGAFAAGKGHAGDSPGRDGGLAADLRLDLL